MAFNIVIRDNVTGAIKSAVRSGIKGVTNWRPYWTGDPAPGASRTSRVGVIQLWADSRHQMFESQGETTGEPWVSYLPRESKYVGYKAAVLGKEIGRTDLLRYKGSAHERLYPGMTNVRATTFLQRALPLTLEVGTNVHYAGRIHRGEGTVPRRIGGPYTPPARRLLGIGHWLASRLARELSDFAGEIETGMRKEFTVRTRDALNELGV